MVIVKGLQEIPRNCDRCPCNKTISGEPPITYCTILALVNKSYFNADPDKHGCPLVKTNKY